MNEQLETYGNRYASAEKKQDGTFDLFNEVAGMFRGNVKTWGEAKNFLDEQKQHYSIIERKFQ